MLQRAAAIALVGIAFSSFAGATPAKAQGSLSAQPKPGYTSLCPTRWQSSGSSCVPGQGAKPAYAPSSPAGPCASGYARDHNWCLFGASSTPMTDAARSSVRKANVGDRCPIAHFTNAEATSTCISQLSRPPVVRAKGSGPCAAGEVEDWGLWCVSDYAHLTRRDGLQVIRDWNAIYTMTGSAPRQPDLPEGSDYSPAYFAIFGRVDGDGNPLGGAPATETTAASSAGSSTSAAAPAACPAPSGNGAAAVGAQIGAALGGRRGALGAALGGLAGAAAARQQRPANCP